MFLDNGISSCLENIISKDVHIVISSLAACDRLKPNLEGQILRKTAPLEGNVEEWNTREKIVTKVPYPKPSVPFNPKPETI